MRLPETFSYEEAGRGSVLLATRRHVRNWLFAGRLAATAAIGALIVAGIPSAFAQSPSTSEITVIHAGTLLATAGEQPKQRQSVIITGGRITSIEDGFVERPGAKTIDLKNSFVLPGLIDSHVHLQFGGDNYISDLATLEDGAELLRAYSEANKALNAGFTTIRDMGGKPEVIFSLREAIKRGVVRGPRIVAAGPAIEPTGGGIIRGLRKDVLGVLLKSNLETACDGPEDCARVTRQAIKDGADFVKIVATGSILSPSAARSQQMTDAEVKAIIEAATGMGKRVSAHAHGLPGINSALNAGVQSIEHGSFANEESMRLFKKTGAYFVPTLSSWGVLRQRVKNPSTDPAVRENVAAGSAIILKVVGMAYKSGVKIAFGTDSNVGMLGGNAGEFRLLKEAGMSETDMLRAATTSAADLVGLGNEIGAIGAGRAADIIAVDASPLEDITVLEKVRFVMSKGEVIRQ